MSDSLPAASPLPDTDLNRLLQQIEDRLAREPGDVVLTAPEAAELVRFLGFQEHMARTQRLLLATCEQLHLRVVQLEVDAGRRPPDPDLPHRLDELSRILADLEPGRDLTAADGPRPDDTPPAAGGRRPLGTIP